VDQQTYYNSQNGLKKLPHILKQASIESKLSQLPSRVLAWENNFQLQNQMCNNFHTLLFHKIYYVKPTFFGHHIYDSCGCIYGMHT